MWKALAAVWLGALAVSGGPGCARAPAGPPVTTDLLDLFPFTDAGQVVDEIDLGAPAAAAHLRSGWSAPAVLPSGGSGVWMLARRASIQLAVTEPRDAPLVVRCGLLGEHAPVMSVLSVALNGRRIGTVRVRRQLADTTLRLPARFERPGPNLIEFSNPLLSDLPRRRETQLARAVAFERIRLPGLGDGAPRATIAAGDPPALVLPAQARVDFFLRLPAAASLVLGGDADPGAALHASVAPDGGREQTLVDGGRPPATLRLPSAVAGQIARVSLATTGTGALRLVQPRVVGRATPSAGDVAPAPPGEPPSILLYVVDTLRADALGCYGYARHTSPSIDALAADGIVYTRAIGQSSWTRPATASILTGTTPARHGAVTLAASLRADAPLLAEVLRAHHYRTAAFVTNVNVRGEFGFNRGFEEYAYLPESLDRPTLHLPAGELVEHVAAWLETHAREPFFLYVHATDPHSPYRPPAALAERVRPPGPVPPIAELADPLRELERHENARSPENLAWVRSLYDGDVAVADEGLGLLVAKLKALGVYDRTIVVVTADHGEEFDDHGGFEHGRTLYREMVAVPLVVRLPGGEGRGTRVAELVRQIDIAPTLLARLGIAVPPRMEGAAVPPVGGPAAREAFSQTTLGSADIMALTTGDWVVIHDVRGPRDRWELYDVRLDPGEQRDVSRERPVLLGYGRQTLARRAVDVPRSGYGARDAAEPFVLDADTRRKLRALGYVGR